MTDYIIDHLFEIIAIIAAFVILFLQLRKKALGYIILTNTSVVSISDEVKDKVVIRYGDYYVLDLWLVEIRIKNIGNVPVRPDDYVEPVRVRTRSSDIMSSQVIDTHSLGVYVETEMSSEKEIVLSKTLLNPKDFFDIKMLLTAGNPEFSVSGRIVGVSKIQRLTGRRKIHMDRILIGGNNHAIRHISGGVAGGQICLSRISWLRCGSHRYCLA